LTTPSPATSVPSSTALSQVSSTLSSTVIRLQQGVGSLSGPPASPPATLNQTYAHLASIADKAGVCGAGGNRLIVLHDSKSAPRQLGWVASDSVDCLTGF
jgi:hypothetical protein